LGTPTRIVSLRLRDEDDRIAIRAHDPREVRARYLRCRDISAPIRVMTQEYPAIDRIDRRLIALLLANARATAFMLADAIGRSASAVGRRQRALEEAGVITGYEARVDLARLGYRTIVHIKMTLESQRKDVLEAFEAAIVTSPSVVRCDLMSGNDDYLVTVRARDLTHFAAIHREELSRLPGVTRMESGFVLREVVSPRLPLALLD
jgi:DNA-binding Lrp family transcriptional regulator